MLAVLGAATDQGSEDPNRQPRTPAPSGGRAGAIGSANLTTEEPAIDLLSDAP